MMGRGWAGKRIFCIFVYLYILQINLVEQLIATSVSQPNAGGDTDSEDTVRDDSGGSDGQNDDDWS